MAVLCEGQRTNKSWAHSNIYENSLYFNINWNQNSFCHAIGFDFRGTQFFWLDLEMWERIWKGRKSNTADQPIVYHIQVGGTLYSMNMLVKICQSQCFLWWNKNKKSELKMTGSFGRQQQPFCGKTFQSFFNFLHTVHRYIHGFYLLPATTTLFSILIYSKQPSCQWLHLLLSSSKPVMLSPTISKSVIVLKYVPTSTSKGGHFVEIFPGHYICFWGVAQTCSRCILLPSCCCPTDWWRYKGQPGKFTFTFLRPAFKDDLNIPAEIYKNLI